MKFHGAYAYNLCFLTDSEILIQVRYLDTKSETLYHLTKVYRMKFISFDLISLYFKGVMCTFLLRNIFVAV